MEKKVKLSPRQDEFGMSLSDENYKFSVEEGTEGILHKWTTKLHPHPANNDVLQEQDFGLVEMPDGSMQYFRPEQITVIKE